MNESNIRLSHTSEGEPTYYHTCYFALFHLKAPLIWIWISDFDWIGCAVPAQFSIIEEPVPSFLNPVNLSWLPSVAPVLLIEPIVFDDHERLSSRYCHWKARRVTNQDPPLRSLINVDVLRPGPTFCVPLSRHRISVARRPCLNVSFFRIVNFLN